MSKVIKKYNDRGHQIYYKTDSSFEVWKKYDKNNNLIHYKDFNGSEFPNGSEFWYKYNENNIRTLITEQEYKEIEFQEKEYMNRERVSRFELMDI